MSKRYDHILKILIVGDSSVGKSSLLVRFYEGTFAQFYAPTIGIDFKIKTVTINGEQVKLQIWDTAGFERFRHITAGYYRNTDGVVIVYDVTNAISFSNVGDWIKEVDYNCPFVNKVLVGNKNDQLQHKIVSTRDAKRFAEQNGVKFFESSAKDNQNTDIVFLSLAEEVLSSKKFNQKRQERNKLLGCDSIKVSKNSERRKKCCFR